MAARGARAGGERMRRIGVLTPFTADDPEAHARLAAFEQGLQQLGWTVGQNIRIDYRWGDGKPDTMRKFADELVALAPDVILANSGAAVSPLLQATRIVPIVFAAVADPVGAGSSRPWHGRVATPRALPPWNIPSVGNGWNCSRRSRRA